MIGGQQDDTDDPKKNPEETEWRRPDWTRLQEVGDDDDKEMTKFLRAKVSNTSEVNLEEESIRPSDFRPGGIDHLENQYLPREKGWN